MKKIISIILLLLGFTLQSCDNDDISIDLDYGCETIYQIENKSDKEIKIIRVYGKLENGDNLSEIVILTSGEIKKIYSQSDVCGKNTTIKEFMGETLPILLNNVSVKVFADNNLIRENLLNKINWSFKAEEYYKATYNLIITNELIETVGYQE